MKIFDYNKAKKLRIEKELPLSEIAKQLYMQLDDYARYERGITEPDSDFVNRLALILNCTADDLICSNVTVIDGFPFTREDVKKLEDVLTILSQLDQISPIYAKYLLNQLNDIIIPLSRNQIAYFPVNFSNHDDSESEEAFRQKVETVYKRFKYVYDVLSRSVLPELLPLMQEVRFPVLKEPYKIPLINALTDTLLKYHAKQELLLPDFSQSETIVVFSDYGGDSGQESYLTYSFLFADYDSIGVSFKDSMNALRRKYFREFPEKEIAFKHIDHYQIRKSLWDYLCMAGVTIHGLLITLVIDRRIKDLFGDIKENAKSFSEVTQVKWKPKVAEKLFRVDTVIAYFLYLLGSTNQKVFWFADDDAIMESEEKAKVATQSIINILNAFENAVKFKLYGYGKNSTFRKMNTSVFTDALSLTDMVGGAVNYYLTWEKKKKGTKFKLEADMICRWLTEQNPGLSKFNILIKPDDKNLKIINISPLKFKLKHGEKMPGNGITYVDILYPTKVGGVVNKFSICKT